MDKSTAVKGLWIGSASAEPGRTSLLQRCKILYSWGYKRDKGTYSTGRRKTDSCIAAFAVERRLTPPMNRLIDMLLQFNYYVMAFRGPTDRDDDKFASSLRPKGQQRGT